MKKYVLSFLVILGLLSSSPGYAQGVFITATPHTSDIQMFMLSDFNFTGQGQSRTDIFELNISNLSDQPVRCILLLQVQAQRQGPMADGKTDPFELAPGQVMRITNRNLFSSAQQFTLQDYRISDVGGKISSELLTTGRLPTDVYFFIFHLLNADDGSEFGQTIIRFNLTNPRTLDLISPGVVANSPEEGVIFTPYPLFRWESDISDFKLVIAEKLADARDDLSPEEIMQQRIVFEKTLHVDRSGGRFGDGVIPSTLYQYPVAGARPLEEGKIYYWQITGMVATSGAPREFQSEIWKFKIKGTGSARILTPLQQQILNLVREMSPELFTPGGDLSGFIPTESVKKNGAEIKPDEIIDILSKIVNGDIETLDIAVE